MRASCLDMEMPGSALGARFEIDFSVPWKHKAAPRGAANGISPSLRKGPCAHFIFSCTNWVVSMGIHSVVLHTSLCLECFLIIRKPKKTKGYSQTWKALTKKTLVKEEGDIKMASSFFFFLHNL